MKVVIYPDPVLEKKADPVEEINEEVAAIAREMIELMHKSHGLGLAAPQVGLSKQIIVVNPVIEPGKEQVYINPQILKRKGRVLGEEGCLSFPGLFGNVVRARWIRVSARLLTGEEVVFEAENFPARVLQHEIDHLQGVLFVQKVQPAEQVALKHRLREMEKLVAT